MSRTPSFRGNRSASMPARLPRDGSRHSSTLGSHSRPRVPCTPHRQIDRYVPSPDRPRRVHRHLPQKPRILTSQGRLDQRMSSANNRREAPKPQQNISNNVSASGDSRPLQTHQSSPVAPTRRNVSPTSVPTNKTRDTFQSRHADVRVHGLQSHLIQDSELGSCARPIVIPSTPRPKSRPLQPAPLQVRRGSTTQGVNDDRGADAAAIKSRPGATTRDKKVFLLEICCRFEEDYLDHEDHELNPNQPFWEKILLTYNEAYEPRYNGEADEQHFPDWESLRSRVMQIISKRYRLKMQEGLKPSKKPWRRAQDAWIKVVAHNKLHQDLHRLWGPFWAAFGDETRNEMESVVEQQIQAYAVPTEEKLREDWQKTRALVQKRCQEQLKRDSAKFIKAKDKQSRREKKRAKRKHRRHHDSKS